MALGPSSTLLYGVITTFDFSADSFLKEYGEAVSRLALFRGDGLTEGDLSLATLVAFPKGENDPVAPFLHAKMRLLCYQEGERKTYLLRIGSQNLYPRDDVEADLFFEGTLEEQEQKGNEPLIQLLDLLSSYVPKSNCRKEILERAKRDLPYLRFTPSQRFGDPYLQGLALSASSFSFYLPASHGLPLFERDYDEELIFSPFLTSDALGPWEKAKPALRHIVASPNAVRQLLRFGLSQDHYLFPTSRFVHAKCYLARIGERYDLYLGSMNLTPYSTSKNVELMVLLENVKVDGGMPSFLSSFLGLEREVARSYFLKEEGDDLFAYASSYALRLSYCLLLQRKRKESEDELPRAIAYLLSHRCVEDLRHLLLTSDFPIVPEQREIEKNHKRRTIYHVSFEEGVLLGMLNHALHREDHRFSPNVYLHVQGRGPKDVFMKIRSYAGFSSLYLVRSDIHDFDPSMDEATLLQAIASFYPNDELTRGFLSRYVQAKDYRKDGQTRHDGHAQKTGLPLSGLLENLYLDDFDKAFEAKAPLYIRCGDDILIGAHTEEEAQAYLEEARARLEAKKLSLSQRKTRIVAPGEPFPFLGYSVQGNEIDLDEEYLQKVLHAIRKRKKALLRLYERKRVIPLLRLPSLLKYLNHDIERYSLKSFFQTITTPKSLKKIDEALLDLIREVASGSKGKEKYRIGSKQLHLFGWRSLVNAYYRHIRRNID